MQIFAGFHREGASSTISSNFEHQFSGRRVLRIYTKHTSLCAASHRAIGYAQNQHPINAMNPVCLNSFRIKSAQSSERKREQNYGRLAYT